VEEKAQPFSSPSSTKKTKKTKHRCSTTRIDATTLAVVVARPSILLFPKKNKNAKKTSLFSLSLSLSLSLRARMAREMSTRALSPSRVRVHGKNTKRESKESENPLSFQRTKRITKRRTAKKTFSVQKRRKKKDSQAFLRRERQKKEEDDAVRSLSLSLPDPPLRFFCFFPHHARILKKKKKRV
jgi:hypothetical protein